MSGIAWGWMVPHDAMDMEFAMAFHGDEEAVGPYDQLLLKKEAAGLTDEEESRLDRLRDWLLRRMIDALWAGDLRARASYPGQLDKIEVPNDFWGRGVEVDCSRNTAKARGILIEALHIYDPRLEAAEARADALSVAASDARGVDHPARLPAKRRGPRTGKCEKVERRMLADIEGQKCSLKDLALMPQKVLAAKYGVSHYTAKKALARVSEIVGISNSDK